MIATEWTFKKSLKYQLAWENAPPKALLVYFFIDFFRKSATGNLTLLLSRLELPFRVEKSLKSTFEGELG